MDKKKTNGRELMRRELGFGGWDGGYWLPIVRCGLGASPELSHRFCCVLKFGNLLFSASIQKVYQTIVNSILSPPTPFGTFGQLRKRGTQRDIENFRTYSEVKGGFYLNHGLTPNL